MLSNIAANSCIYLILHEACYAVPYVHYALVFFLVMDFIDINFRFNCCRIYKKFLANSVLSKKLNSMAFVRKRTIPTERPPLVGEVSANLCW
jgi:hypothetical protein